ncbi:hypothetical protein ASA1KI_07600 [Opitutales bacterium ASA1]|uniref:hypothetical protein n=1 Tax=Congregicoccus parvus TaxID=3081749 RepID=UPI002B2A38A0|nr:hypothetical protein ASA1KI_07600 [Opitutales bacterium ASA1]
MKTSTSILLALATCLPAPVLLGEQSETEVEASRFRSSPRVVLFDAAYFRGESIELRPGQELQNLGDVRFPNGARVNDTVSSILVESGAEVLVAEASRFRGATVRIDSSIENLRALPRSNGGTWNDVISSVRVERSGSGRPPGHGRPPGGRDRENEPRVIVYSQSNYRGDSFEILPGERFADLSRRSFDGWARTNDEISSIRVVGPVRARVGVAREFGGGVLDVTADIPDLGRVARAGGGTWNDVVSSIEVSRAPGSDRPGGPRPPVVDAEPVIRRVFDELLGRSPTAAELTEYRRAFHEHGWNEANLGDALRRTAEYRDRLRDALPGGTPKTTPKSGGTPDKGTR